ncbi:preprotein translocase subunit SecY [bacterium]|nr:preprotein translocase subunit SecY [bacterium]
MSGLLGSLANIFRVSDLRRRIGFTLSILAVYRLGSHVPLPGVNSVVLRDFMDSAMSGGFLKYLDLFSGGALKRVAILSLGIMPYISASIMMQLLTVIVPTFEALAKEGDYGRKIINQYTRYLALGLSVMQGLVFSTVLERAQDGLILCPGWGFRLTTVLFLSVGSLFVMWLGEQINQYGIGQGSSLLIFAGIVAAYPGQVLKVWGSVNAGQIDPLLAGGILAFVLALISCIVFLERGERRVTIQYAKRVIGQKVYGGVSSYIPFKLNSANVVPVIFAGAMLGMPMMLLKGLFSRFEMLKGALDWIDYGAPLHTLITVALIIFFSFFYTSMIFNPVELADNLRKSGGFIPGVRPGRKTAEFFEYLLMRVSLPGAIYLAALAVMPDVVLRALSSPISLSGISLLIAVGVALDTSSQLEAALIERRYDGFLSSGRMKGRYAR